MLCNQFQHIIVKVVLVLVGGGAAVVGLEDMQSQEVFPDVEVVPGLADQFFVGLRHVQDEELHVRLGQWLLQLSLDLAVAQHVLHLVQKPFVGAEHLRAELGLVGQLPPQLLRGCFDVTDE